MNATMQYQPPASASSIHTTFFLPQFNSIPEECVPPSSSPGDPYRPTIELSKPVYEIDSRNSHCIVTGEIELDTTLFTRMPYSIGIALSTPQSDKPLEWNQDGGGNYNRARSFIQLGDRLLVDDSCFMRFRIEVPSNLVPAPKSSQVYSVQVRAYALANPNICTNPSSVQFMILNRSSSGPRRNSTVV